MNLAQNHVVQTHAKVKPVISHRHRPVETCHVRSRLTASVEYCGYDPNYEVGNTSIYKLVVYSTLFSVNQSPGFFLLDKKRLEMNMPTSRYKTHHMCVDWVWDIRGHLLPTSHVGERYAGSVCLVHYRARERPHGWHQGALGAGEVPRGGRKIPHIDHLWTSVVKQGVEWNACLLDTSLAGVKGSL